ncbi:hypothetical protein [Flavobacterium sp.]|jgi:hypothetical protein|uniref:hypothetical protein n=1 Tax=Flavobacterium sp. TaxID=239 RepID=UPI00391DD4DB
MVFIQKKVINLFLIFCVNIGYYKNKIGCISCETLKNEYDNIYYLGDDSESGFKELLDENYYLVAKGWENLED